MFVHLLIVLHCHDVINFLDRKIAQIENNGLSRWLNENSNGQSVLQIFRIDTSCFDFRAVLLNCLGLFIMVTSACLAGVSVFAYYAMTGCDPISSKKIRNANQVCSSALLDLLYISSRTKKLLYHFCKAQGIAKVLATFWILFFFYSKPFWRYVKAKQQDNIGVSPLKRKGQLLSDSRSKADILVNQFSSVFTQDSSLSMPSVVNSCDTSIGELKITEEGVLKLLRNILKSKAPGPDSIPNRVLKECATQLAPSITVIFQKSVDSGRLPKDWLNANIAPVYKKGDRHLPENYRPVSLTSVLSKLLEHIVCRHMLKTLRTP